MLIIFDAVGIIPALEIKKLKLGEENCFSAVNSRNLC